MKAGESEVDGKEGWWETDPGGSMRTWPETLSVPICVIQGVAEEPPEAGFQELTGEGVRVR